MFRSCHKNGVIKKLLRLTTNADVNGDGGDEAKRARSTAAAKRLIRRLSVGDLEDLLRVVEQGGRGETCAGGQCVSASSSLSRGPQTSSIVSAMLQLLRWPDFGDDEVLRRLPMCSDEVGRGCNPYHWSRIGEFMHPNYLIDSKMQSLETRKT